MDNIGIIYGIRSELDKALEHYAHLFDGWGATAATHGSAPRRKGDVCLEIGAESHDKTLQKDFFLSVHTLVSSSGDQPAVMPATLT